MCYQCIHIDLQSKVNISLTLHGERCKKCKKLTTRTAVFCSSFLLKNRIKSDQKVVQYVSQNGTIENINSSRKIQALMQLHLWRNKKVMALRIWSYFMSYYCNTIWF